MERLHVLVFANCKPILDSATRDRWVMNAITPQMKLQDITGQVLAEHDAYIDVRVEGSSGDALQRARLDDPQASPDDPRRRLDEHMGCAIEDYERAIAARSRGLVRGRTAWNDGRECWLVDFPLVVLVVNRMRTPAARRFRTASYAHALSGGCVMSLAIPASLERWLTLNTMAWSRSCRLLTITKICYNLPTASPRNAHMLST